MKMQSLTASAAVTILIFSPGMVFGANACQPAKTRPKLDAVQLSRRAFALLKDIREDAQRVRYHAGVIQNLSDNDESLWGAQEHELRRIKAEVDDMGRRLCALEINQQAVAPWEQRAIRQATPLIRYLADNTDDAILFANRHQSALWSPRYKQNAQNLYGEASALTQTIGRSAARQKSENAYLRRNSGMLEVFGH
jgi:hypothetical protein